MGRYLLLKHKNVWAHVLHKDGLDNEVINLKGNSRSVSNHSLVTACCLSEKFWYLTWQLAPTSKGKDNENETEFPLPPVGWLLFGYMTYVVPKFLVLGLSLPIEHIDLKRQNYMGGHNFPLRQLRLTLLHTHVHVYICFSITHTHTNTPTHL